MLVLCALAFASLGFAPVASVASAPTAAQALPAAPAPTAAPAPAPAAVAPAGSTAADASQIVICVRFRDWGVPGTGITFEKPADQFCVELPDVNPDMLPVREDRA